MKKTFVILCLLICLAIPYSAGAKELPKIAVWDLEPREVKINYARELTSILVSEISKVKRFEVYSQENVRTLAGWTEERMKLGCTNTQCLTALGQMDIAKLISGSVGRIGNRYSVSLNLFDTQNAKAENAVSEFGRSEDELIDLVQVAVKKLLGLALEPAPPARKVSKREDPYLGCFKDQQTGQQTYLSVSGRDLNGFAVQRGNMTIDMCISICRERGFGYAGIQAGQQCFCGKTYGKYGKAENCGTPCSGNPGQICGGSWANSVYRVK